MKPQRRLYAVWFRFGGFAGVFHGCQFPRAGSQVALFDDVAGEYQLQCHGWDGDAFRVEYGLRCDAPPPEGGEGCGAYGGGSCDGGGGADGGW